MQIRIRESGAVMFWNEFRDLLLAQNPSELITVAPQTEEWLNAHGADLVFEGSQGSTTRYQVAFVDGVEQDSEGRWFTKWSVADMDQTAKDAVDAAQAQAMRTDRNEKLAKCDWTQLADSTADKTAWATYRQALRDVPSQTGFPWEITWPTQP
jgi:hypothetical protein